MGRLVPERFFNPVRLKSVSVFGCRDMGSTMGRQSAPGISPALVRQFLTPVVPEGRTPGFDVPTPGQSSAGRYFSPQSVGHTGFTGTSFWIDLDQGQMVVLLTNRVHLGRDHDKIKAFRPRFHEAVSEALGCHRQ